MLRCIKLSLLGTLTALAVNIAAAVPQQTTQDSMSGNWPVINGQKRFMSGMNLAWINFATDVGDKGMDINSFTDKIKQIRKAGGNAMRWWIHTDASNCPKIDVTGAVTGLGANTIKNLRAALDTAFSYGVAVDMCLFSFDMLVPGDGTGKAGYSSFNLESNYLFLTDTTKITTYLEKGLKPLLDSVGSHPAVLCWEAFNEPEGMLASANWAHVTKKITQQDILRITNRIAGFVHRNSKKMASSGIASFSYITEYSDAKLLAAGGDPDGYLDFYMAHYYPEWQDAAISPFAHPAAFWNMDRPILIGEFPANDWNATTMGPSSNQPLKTSMTSIAAFAYAYDNGYAGALSWAMTEQNAFFGSYETTAPSLSALFTAHKNDIMIKDVVVAELSGDLAMQITLDLPAATATPEAELSGTFNFTDVDSLIADVYLPAGTTPGVKMLFVIKSTSDWVWCPSNVTLTPATTGTWLRFAVPVATFASAVTGKTLNLADVKQLVIQFIPATTAAFKGALYLDNVRSKKGSTETIISDFNKTGSSWSEYEVGTADNIQIALAQRPTGTAVNPRRAATYTVADCSIATMGKKLLITGNHTGSTLIRILDITGKSLITKDFYGLPANVHTVDCSRLAAGTYVIEFVAQEKSFIAPLILKQ